ncbi:MAG: glutathione S-transferase N-terminal domain-containing protein [Ectothiorhodospiraceae bacterium]
MRSVIRLFFRTLRRVLTPFMIVGNRLTMPRGIQRDPQAQAAVDRAVQQGLALYHFPACPFCIKVRREAKRLSLDLPLRNAQQPGENRETLASEGGQVKVPCLQISEPDGSTRWLYESDDIIDYLRQRFGPEGSVTENAA